MSIAFSVHSFQPKILHDWVTLVKVRLNRTVMRCSLLGVPRAETRRYSGTSLIRKRQPPRTTLGP